MYWLKLFTDFLEMCERIAMAQEQDAPDRLRVLAVYVSAEVYEIIDDCAMYDEAISRLKRAYIKSPNSIFAKHELATRKQKPEESLRKFMQALLVLSKDCNFRDVTAKEYKNQMVRDAFISGLSSHDIHQRLLENNELSLDRAFDIANSLDMAIEHSTGYFPLENVSAAANNLSDDFSPETMNVGTSDIDASPGTCSTIPKTKKCYFCGKDYCLRHRCPARDAVCHSCGKTGHFSRVWRSRRIAAPKLVSQSSSVSFAISPSLCTMSAACPGNL